MNRRTPYILLAFLMLCTACSSSDADYIINQSIRKHGGQAFSHSQISFIFRDVQYKAMRDKGHFEFTRIMNDSTGHIKDRLTNNGLSRTVNGKPVQLSDEDSSSYANSLNSVIYFAELPYKLNDAAVHKEYLGKTTIKGEPYFEIKVTFAKKSGGKDHQDEYIYWIHRKRFTMDYLAYLFHVNEGGTRFREAYNIRTVKGIRFADYHNYGSPDMEHPLEKYDTYFNADTLNKVSEIRLRNITVKLLDK